MDTKWDFEIVGRNEGACDVFLFGFADIENVRHSIKMTVELCESMYVPATYQTITVVEIDK
jgi:hypothetical protein